MTYCLSHTLLCEEQFLNLPNKGAVSSIFILGARRPFFYTYFLTLFSFCALLIDMNQVQSTIFIVLFLSLFCLDSSVKFWFIFASDHFMRVSGQRKWLRNFLTSNLGRQSSEFWSLRSSKDRLKFVRERFLWRFAYAIFFFLFLLGSAQK